MVRLFVATWPASPVLEALRSVERPEQPDLRFTTEDQWHVTLRFLGTVSDDDVAEVASTLDAVRSSAAVDAEVQPRPRRLGATAVVYDVDGLEPVAAAVADAVGSFGGDDRRFHGHITIARMRRPGHWPSGGVGPLSGAIRWPVRDVTLVQSHLGRGPARYETLATIALDERTGRARP